MKLYKDSLLALKTLFYLKLIIFKYNFCKIENFVLMTLIINI